MYGRTGTASDSPPPPPPPPPRRGGEKASAHKEASGPPPPPPPPPREDGVWENFDIIRMGVSRTEGVWRVESNRWPSWRRLDDELPTAAMRRFH